MVASGSGDGFCRGTALLPSAGRFSSTAAMSLFMSGLLSSVLVSRVEEDSAVTARRVGSRVGMCGTLASTGASPFGKFSTTGREEEEEEEEDDVGS